MDKSTTPKTAWPLNVQEIKQQTVTILENCALTGEPLGFFIDIDRVTEIMRSGAAALFRAMVKDHEESQPDFLPEQLEELADETVTATLRLAPFRLAKSLRYKESVPAIREALRAELQAVLRQRAPEPEESASSIESVKPERKAERKRLRDAYKAERKQAGVKVTDEMIAITANPPTSRTKGWHTRDAIQKWLQCDPKYDGEPDRLIRKGL
jgi:FKBP-type peptidyl-prolyl cis-trans isomerase 2